MDYVGRFYDSKKIVGDVQDSGARQSVNGTRIDETFTQAQAEWMATTPSTCWEA
jgi:hypothetical protein